MIIHYDKNPNFNTDQKLQSLMESIQLALNECIQKENLTEYDFPENAFDSWILDPKISNDSGSLMYRAERSDTGTLVGFGIGSGGINHGVWSKRPTGKWLIHANSNNEVVVDQEVVVSKQSPITNAASIITASSDATIASASYVQWGQIAQAYIKWNNVNAISVPASGNIGNVTIGTLVSGKRPAIPIGAWSSGDQAGAAWYSADSSGQINLGAVEGTGVARTIAAGTEFRLFTTYILP